MSCVRKCSMQPPPKKIRLECAQNKSLHVCAGVEGDVGVWGGV